MGFTTLDAVVLILYMAAVTGAGMWTGRGQRGANDYFLGNRDVPWGPVLLSVVATETSTLTFLSIPGLAYATDLGFLQISLGYLVGRVVVAFVLLPAYFRGELTTAYALLEQRFGLATRRAASTTFMVTRALADGVRLFATAIPLALITGWSYPTSILAIGLLTVVYTYYGGIRAVIWTDSVQLFVYVGGAIGALYMLLARVPGGWAAVSAAAGGAGKLQVIHLGWDLSRPYTLWAGVIGGAFLAMASHGTDHIIVQRLLTCRDLRQSQMALIGSAFVVIAQFALFLVIGLALWSFYEAREFARTDEIFAAFIVNELPAGMTGIVIAAIFAAAMSSLSSSVNSLASATTYDLYAPLRAPSEAQLLQAGRIFTLFWSAVLVGGALLFRSRDTPLVEIGLAIASFTYGGLLGLFLLGILHPRATQRDALWAFAVALAAMSVVVFGRLYARAFQGLGMEGAAELVGAAGGIAYPWHVVLGTTIAVAVGSVLALFHPRGSARAGTAEPGGA